MECTNVYYWNCADDRNHTHQRIETAIKNEVLTCYNIKITKTLFNIIKKNDIILVYEPKVHKKSKTLYDGYCINCNEDKLDGRQAFTHAFKIIKPPVKLSSFNEEQILGFNITCGIWNEDETLEDYKSYCNDYYGKGNFKYIFKVKLLGKLTKSISTLIRDDKYYYNRPMVKGFNKVFCCGCNNLLECNNSLCIYNYLNKDKNIKDLLAIQLEISN
jgi:hypothetical protein